MLQFLKKLIGAMPTKGRKPRQAKITTRKAN